MKAVILRIIGCVYLLFGASAARSESHGGPNRAVIDEASDCTTRRFNELHGTFTLQNAYDQRAAENYNQRFFRLGADKKISEKAPYPLIGASPDISHETKEIHPVYSVGGSYFSEISHFLGWRYEAPASGTFRLALAQAMLCETNTQNAGFGKTMRYWLANEGIYKMYLTPNGESSSYNAGQSSLGDAKLMLSIFDELKTESSTQNPLIIEFLRQIFLQMRATERSFLEKTPLVFTEGFKKQIEKIRELTQKPDRTRNESELLAYFETFSTEPRFSYLMHPLIASYAKSAIKAGVLQSSNRTINPRQMQDVMNQLSRILNDQTISQAWINTPQSLAGTISHESNEPSLHVPDPASAIAKAVDAQILKWQQLSSDKRESLRKKMQDDLFTLLANYDGLKHAPSPQMHSLRENILDAARRLAPSVLQGQAVTETIDALSLNQPSQTLGDRDLLRTISNRVGSEYAPEALIGLSHFDEITKRLVHAINRPFAKDAYYDGQKIDLAKFLQTGSSTDLFRALMNSPSFLLSAANELKTLGADSNASALLIELSNQKSMTQQQFDRYRELRSKLKDTLLSIPFQTLNKGQRATLMTLALLDEFGLSGVTERDKDNDPNRYLLGSIYMSLNDESTTLKKIALLAGIDEKRLETEIYDHAGYIYENRTGITPEIRNTIVARLRSQSVDKTSASLLDQLSLIDFAKDRLHGAPPNARPRAVMDYATLVSNPITLDILDKFAAQHLGFDAYSYFTGGTDLEYVSQSIPTLAEQGFFDETKFLGLLNEYERHRSALSAPRRHLSESILDYARVHLTRLAAGVSQQPATSDDYAKHFDAVSLQVLIDSVLQPSLTDPLWEHGAGSGPIIEAVFNDLNGIDADLEEKILTLWPAPRTKDEQDDLIEKLGLIRRGLEILKGADIASHLKDNPDVNSLMEEYGKWDLTLSRQLPLADGVDRFHAEIVLDELNRYQKALTGVGMAALQSPNQAMPKSQHDLIRKFFTDEETIPKILQALNQDSAAYEKVKNTLVAAGKAAESAAAKASHLRHQKTNSIVNELTQSDRFAQHKIGFNPFTNSIIIARDSLIDQQVIDKLAELGGYNLYIESENRDIFFRGDEGLNDWLRQKRFDYGYADRSDLHNGKFIGEQYLPVTDKTAVKVYRVGDGKYEYDFKNADDIRTKLTKDNELLAARRKQWIETQNALAGAWHATKAYVGNAGRAALSPIQSTASTFGLARGVAPIETSEERELAKSYNAMMKALQDVTQAGHVTDADNISGIQASRNHRAVIADKLEDEALAIERFISKVEVIHDITTTLITIPLAGGLQATLFKAANAVKASSTASRFAARLLLTTARAARAYRRATVTAAKTAGLFTAVGTAVEGGVLGVQSLGFGDGPRMIRDKLALFEKNRQKGINHWRTYKDHPKLSKFGITSIERATKKQREEYDAAVFEYEIEEAMDPDYDGIPENHSYMDRKINGHTSLSDLAFSPVEQFAGNWKFFQGLNLARNLPLHGGGLPGEMAFASVWSNFHPTDPYLDRVKRREDARVASEQRRALAEEPIGKKPDTRRRSLLEIAGYDALGGAYEGLRFGLALAPVQRIVRSLPTEGLKGFGSRLLATGAFVAFDEALKYGSDTVRTGELKNPLNNPDLAKELAHSLAIGGYIGYSSAKAGQAKSREARIKEELGIGREGKMPPEKQKTISEIIESEFGRNEGRALLFLKTLTPQEIAGAPEAVRREHLEIMKGQWETALKEIDEFAKQTKHPELSKAASDLRPVITQIQTLNQQAFRRELTSPEINQLKNLKLKRDLLLFQITGATEPMANAAAAARRVLDSRLSRVTRSDMGNSDAALKSKIEAYEQNGALIDQALIRLDTIATFEQPIEATSAVLSPSSGYAKEFLKGHPDARVALEREEKRRHDSPKPQEGLADFYVRVLEPAHLGPKLSSEGYEKSQLKAANAIVLARQRSENPSEKAQLLDVLRLVDPRAAVRIEDAEAGAAP